MISALLLATALSHGVPPQALQVVQQPGPAPQTTLIGVTFGALVSTDACSWQWVCDQSVGYGKDERPVWYVGSSGALFAATYSGLYRSADIGCSWSKAEALAATGATDLIGDGASLLATSGKFGVENALFRSTDDGLSWARTALGSSTEYFSGVRRLGSTVYVSSWYFEPQQMALSVSTDGAESFSRIELTTALPGGVKGPFTVHAIDPASAQTLYASVVDDAARPQVSHLLVSRNGGKDWEERLSATGRVAQVVIAGDSVWVALGSSVYRSVGGAAFAALPSPTANACVATVGERVVACGAMAVDGYSVADLSEGGATSWFTWAMISGPQRCPAMSGGANICASDWPVERAEFGIEDAGLPACAGTPERRPCGCSAGSGGLGLLALVALRRKTNGR